VANRRHQEGFSLIEAIVAFAILMLALTTLYYGTADAYRRIANSEEQNLVTAYARAEIEVRLADTSAAIAPARGTFPNGIEWQLDVSAIATPGAVLETEPVMLVLTARDRQGREIIALKTIALQARSRR
jgi:Tfp pilus assembly protein PilV